MFLDKYLESAFLYELSKRILGKYEFNEPWDKLYFTIQDGLAERWSHPDHEVPVLYKTFARKAKPNEVFANEIKTGHFSPEFKPPYEGWTHFLCVSFNTRRGFSGMFKGLKIILEDYFRQQEMPKSNHRITKIRNRSFLIIEALDKKIHGLPTDDPTVSRYLQPAELEHYKFWVSAYGQPLPSCNLGAKPVVHHLMLNNYAKNEKKVTKDDFDDYMSDLLEEGHAEIESSYCFDNFQGNPSP